MIYREIMRAVGYLFIAGIAGFAYSTARNSAKTHGPKNALWKGFLWCFSIAVFASLTLGNPSCEDYDSGPYGGCNMYADDSFEPTGTERVASFSYFMTLLYVPVVYGLFKSD